mmetsp:Transcript_3018/g.6838  ORF Transcript_3018/g.6838 Transcript_3018/m.6838 type:complete len:202 (-) Transcript_3018:366-971(-)
MASYAMSMADRSVEGSARPVSANTVTSEVSPRSSSLTFLKSLTATPAVSSSVRVGDGSRREEGGGVGSEGRGGDGGSSREMADELGRAEYTSRRSASLDVCTSVWSAYRMSTAHSAGLIEVSMPLLLALRVLSSVAWGCCTGCRPCIMLLLVGLPSLLPTFLAPLVLRMAMTGSGCHIAERQRAPLCVYSDTRPLPKPTMR